MDTPKTVNIRSFAIWIAENGDGKARLRLCQEADFSLSTLNKILNQDYVPGFGIRYRLSKVMGIAEEELFPTLEEINAS